jgi:inositol hexakisphosphate/diphosphoinositol-pentakisphosphate kinase
MQTVLEAGGSFAGVNRKVQLKPTIWTEPEEGSTEQPRVVEALLILKHGGVLTHAGRQQVRDLPDYQGSAHGKHADPCCQAVGAVSYS